MATAETSSRQIVFVQHSVHLAGAQKSLSRLLVAPGLRASKPILITAEQGWLTDFCSRNGVSWVCLPFPSSRSFSARWMGGNRQFSRRASAILQPFLLPGHDVIVHANDHPDSLIGLSLAEELNARSVLTLRTPQMSQRDFVKYGGLYQNHVIAVGNELATRANAWLPKGGVTLIHNGVTDQEILSPASLSSAIPNSILVLGSLSPRKGWQDLISALEILEQRLPDGPLPEIHFLGDLLGLDPVEVLGTRRLTRFKTIFLGVVDAYRDCLRQYALAIHPSRSESFGMAALECVAAGVPLLAARTGVIPQFVPCEDFLFSPQDINALVARLEPFISTQIEDLGDLFQMRHAQRHIRNNFSTRGTVERLIDVYSKVVPSS